MFEAKSTSEARDLFYTYDSLGRFQAKSEKNPIPDPRDFIHYNALGEAILQTRPLDEVKQLLPREDWKHRGPMQSVVLIDEIDKAPRDLPNDLLNEIDRLYFKVPEMGNTPVEAATGLEPVIVITSNSEKNLPAAFLRRCIYYHIPFPEDRLEEIIVARLAESAEAGSALVKQAIDFFLYLRRDHQALEKLPATAELLDWLLYITQRGTGKQKGLVDEPDDTVVASLGTLLKRERDQKRRLELWKTWKTNFPSKES
jgi:MoxR-like ATPase